MTSQESNLLNQKSVYEILKEFFPARNDFSECEYEEELEELVHFGITSHSDFRNLLSKHRSRILEIDSEPLNDRDVEVFKKEYGEEHVDRAIEGNYWFAFPALLRLALELEFGDDYREFAQARDGI